MDDLGDVDVFFRRGDAETRSSTLDKVPYAVARFGVGGGHANMRETVSLIR